MSLQTLFSCGSALPPELCLLFHWPVHVSLGPAPKPRSAILSQDKSGINTTVVGICIRKKNTALWYTSSLVLAWRRKTFNVQEKDGSQFMFLMV